MIVNTKQLKAELEWAARFIEKKTTIPVLVNVAIVVQNGILKLTATDLETAGLTSVSGNGEDSWSITVPPKMVLQYLKSIKVESITLSAEGLNLIIRHGAESTAFSGISSESYPEIPPVPESMYCILTGLEKLAPRVLACVSASESRFTLNGALIEVNDRHSVIVSTDGQRLSVIPIAPVAMAGHFKALIPAFALTEAGRLNTAVFGFNEKHLSFISGSRTILAQKMTGNFPDYERVLPKDLPNEAIVSRDHLSGAMKRMLTFADARSKAITLSSLGNSKIHVSAYSVDRGSGASEVDAAILPGAAPWTAGVCAAYLDDFLSKCPSEAVTIKAPNNNEKTGHITGSIELTDGSWRYVVMPMRI